MIVFKPGVRLVNILPHVVLAITVANDIYRMFGQSVVVTSVNDSTHKPGSFHYRGGAVDLRIKHIPHADREKLVTMLRRTLSPVGFDVLWEAKGTDNEHIHVEFDPK